MEKAKKLMLSMVIIFMATPLYAADKAIELATTVLYYPSPASIIINHAKNTSFSDWVNITHIDTKDDADILRAEWKQALGVDIFFCTLKQKK